MRHQNVTVFDTAAQVSCAQTLPQSFSDMGTISAQPGFRPIRRRDLMAAVNTIGRDLGLRPASVLVLDVLLSCLPCKHPTSGKEMAITPDMLLTVFACNKTLCFRAKGITERQLRRHLEKLEHCGLIQRRDSANGKRFPIHRGGKLVGAFGIDLSPLLAQSGAFSERAHKATEDAAELRGLKARIQKLRAECLAIPLTETARSYVEATRNQMRRVGATLTEANAIIARLIEILRSGQARQEPKTSTPEPAQTNPMPAADGQNVRHKESEKPDTKKTIRTQLSQTWRKLTCVPTFFPDEPRSEHGYHSVVYQLANMLGIEQNAVAHAIARVGLLRTLTVQDRIAARIDQIDHPARYFSNCIIKDKVGHGQLHGTSMVPTICETP